MLCPLHEYVHTSKILSHPLNYCQHSIAIDAVPLKPLLWNPYEKSVSNKANCGSWGLMACDAAWFSVLWPSFASDCASVVSFINSFCIASVFDFGKNFAANTSWFNEYNHRKRFAWDETRTCTHCFSGPFTNSSYKFGEGQARNLFFPIPSRADLITPSYLQHSFILCISFYFLTFK